MLYSTEPVLIFAATNTNTIHMPAHARHIEKEIEGKRPRSLLYINFKRRHTESRTL